MLVVPKAFPSDAENLETDRSRSYGSNGNSETIVRSNVLLSEVFNLTELQQIYELVMKNDISIVDEYYGNITRWNPMYFGYQIITNNTKYPYIQFGGVHNPYYFQPYYMQDDSKIHLTKVTNSEFVNEQVIAYTNQTFLHWSNGSVTAIENLRCPICGEYVCPFEPEFYTFLMFWQCLDCRVIVHACMHEEVAKLKKELESLQELIGSLE